MEERKTEKLEVKMRSLTIKARGYIFRPNLLGSILKWGNMFHYSIENLFGNFRTMFLYALGFFTQTYWSPC